MTQTEGARGALHAPFALAGTTARISSLSHLRDQHLKRMLSLAGIELRFGWPRSGDCVAIWGNAGRTARRGAALAKATGTRCLYVEEAFLRSVRPGKAGLPVHGLLLDTQRPYYDGQGSSDLEDLLLTHTLDDTERGSALIASLRAADLSKYNTHDPSLEPPEPGYVLVVDQVSGDASIAGAGADAARFQNMLEAARAENPHRKIIIKGHPGTYGTGRSGHFSDASPLPVSPWKLLDGAHAVYTVSSQLGFEAILAGHRPHVFGQPFYAGWGLTEDRFPLSRRDRHLTPAQLALGALALYPIWYDPCRDRACTVEDTITLLEARTCAWREDHRGTVALGMRLWKRPSIVRFFGAGPVTFAPDAARGIAKAAETGRPLAVWASKAPPELVSETENADVPLCRIEDGFLRSRGLGAALTPPLSLVRDQTGIYYDPETSSDLEHAVAHATARGASLRAQAVLDRVRRARLSKYNLQVPAFSCASDAKHPRILVVGQVADDASVTRGRTAAIPDTHALLRAARAAHPEAHLIYKPHPDVEAQLRDGQVTADIADTIAREVDPISVLLAVDEVWTISSLLGFEALIHGRKVVCAGLPFYAGWGLTEDLGPRDHPVFARRTARPDLAALVEAALILYPRYRDPISGLPCPVEVILDRLETGADGPPPRPLLWLSKLQGLFASQSWMWR